MMRPCYIIKMMMYRARMFYIIRSQRQESAVIERRSSAGGASEGKRGARNLQRLFFIDFRAYFLGQVSRADIAEFFGISLAAATRDLAAYIREHGGRIVLDGTAKIYRPSQDFVPVFEHPVEQVLSALSQGLGEAQSDQPRSLIPAAFPRPLSLPKPELLAPVTRAIHQQRVIKVGYHSYSSGQTERELRPHALVNNGSRWHVRAYDRRRGDFNDFVLARMSSVEVLPASGMRPEEAVTQDIQWTRIVELELVPHPFQERPEITSMDFDMKGDLLRVRERAALVGYLLRQWNVDCSPRHTEKSPPETNPSERKGDEIRLWLRNHLALYGVDSAKMAPGYVPPTS